MTGADEKITNPEGRCGGGVIIEVAAEDQEKAKLCN